MNAQNPITTPKRPLPPRPTNGLLAWQTTMGHISHHHSPDAILKLHTYSQEARVYWDASVSWGANHETTTHQTSLAAALRELWREVCQHHIIYDTLEDAIKSPQNYGDSEWLDMTTQETLQRLIWVIQIAFPGDWLLVTVYQPVEAPHSRVQMRLLAKGDSITVGGRGATVLDACRALLSNATPHFAAQSSVHSQ